MEPVQGVWQDDPTFEDRKQKQITLTAYPATYNAELPMIAGRDTALYGIDHYEAGGKRYRAPGHFEIVISGLTTCTVKEGVVARFAFTDSAGQHDLGMGGGGQIPLLGPPLPNNGQAGWSVTMRTFPPGLATFQIAPGNYDISVQLELNGQPTGYAVHDTGTSVTTAFPPVVFVPIMLSPKSGDDLTGKTHDLQLLPVDAGLSARELQAQAADYVPVKPGTVVATAQPLLDYSAVVTNWLATYKQDQLIANLTSRLTALGVLTKAGRVIVVLRDGDFDSMRPLSWLESLVIKGSVVGDAINAKVVLVREFTSWTTPFHELLHTLPYLWSTDQMESECGQGYHNFADTGVANGVRMYAKGVAIPRAVVAGATAILGRLDEHFYIAQCTYAHLAQQLQGSNDPQTLFVRATAARNGRGGFDPLYTLDGEIDTPAKTGTWAIVLRDAAGRQLQRAPFTPNWDVATLRAHRNFESVFFRFPMRANVASVELRGPRGVVARDTLSPSPPVVTIVAPASVARGTRRVPIAWRTRTAGGRAALATVLYSTNGKLYAMQSFEQTESAFNVKLDPRAVEHWIKVIVTDGTRSGEREIVLGR